TEMPRAPSHQAESLLPHCAVSVAIPLTMMLTGVAGNALAMLLVSRSYRAKGSRRKRSFLLCIGSLALTDMLGQLLTSPIVISVYLSGRPWAAMDPSGRLCDFFGFSMTVFGLCPLLIASAMAVERALAIRAPHWYASHMSPRATERGLAAIWAAGVAFALLPLAGLGRYALQWPGTWCFISTAGGSAFAAAFAALGLLSLVVTGACNLATIEALVSRCRAKAGAPQPGSRWGRIATETLLQLLGIMCVLSACWAPLLSGLWKPPQPQHCAGCKRPPSPGMRLIPSGIMMDRGFELLERGVHLHWHCYVAKQKLLSPRPHCWPRPPALPLLWSHGSSILLCKPHGLSSHKELCQAFPACSSS
uniref:Prostaglandin E2 receptor EP3 subtype n=1 Tax=Junco hyemalis TaxID=40217 RepID=A0A8C5J798_JUNHY